MDRISNADDADDSPSRSNPRLRKDARCLPSIVDHPLISSSTGAADAGNSSSSSSSFVRSLRTAPDVRAGTNLQRHSLLGLQLPANSYVLDHLIGHQQSQQSPCRSNNDPIDIESHKSLTSGIKGGIDAQRQQYLFLDALKRGKQSSNQPLSDMLSNQYLLQRQRLLQLQQMQSQEAISYYLLQQRLVTDSVNSHRWATNSNIISGGSLAHDTRFQATGRNILGDSLNGANNANQLLSFFKTQPAQQEHLQSLLQPQSQQGLSSQSMNNDVSRMVDALFFEQQLSTSGRLLTADLAGRRTLDPATLSSWQALLNFQNFSSMHSVSAPEKLTESSTVATSNHMAQNLAEASSLLSRIRESNATEQNGAYGVISNSAKRLKKSTSDSSLAMPSGPPTALISIGTSNNATFVSGAQTQPKNEHKIIPMAIPADKQTLSEYQCLVREQIMFFAANDEDVSGSVQGRNRPIVLGQVGIHCIHCWREQHRDQNTTVQHRYTRQKPRGASYYPSKLSGIYQAAQNMVTNHFMESCRNLPMDVRNKLVAPRSNVSGGFDMQHQQKQRQQCPPISATKRGWATSNAGGGKQYWANAAQMLGIGETEEHGLVFTAQFNNGSGITNPDAGQ